MTDQIEWDHDWEDAEEAMPPGWYATLYCWDIAEGIFEEANYWDGKKFSKEYPTSAVSTAFFDSEKEAYDWAYRNNPDNASFIRKYGL